MAAAPDAIELLVEYLRIDTTNPPGNEEAGAAWMAGILNAAGVETDVLLSAPGRGNLVARLRSPDPSDAARANALCLLNHIDVVPADPSEWSVDPFGAVQRDGSIWARGAIDMKGMGIMQLLAVLALARDGTPLTRDVLFVASADEETGGAMGAKWLLENHPDLMACSDVINEGGYGLRDTKPPIMACGLSEKSILQLRLAAHGTAGHASMPPDDQALVRLVAALHDLATHPPRLTLDPLVMRTLQVIADRSPPLRRRALRALLSGRGQQLLPLMARRMSRHEKAVLGNVISLTQIDAGYKVNVVPGRVAASIDCRLLPGTANDEFLAEIRGRLAKHDVEIESVILSDTASGASDGPLLPVLQKVCEEEFPDAVFAPTLFPAFTDSRFFRRAGADAYGLVPVMLSDAEVAGFHGVDERIPVAGFLRGVEVMERLVRRVCT
jgi:acetylornithine deacetylase/succinyl-diaminopimelate desuccinylase-like protein